MKSLRVFACFLLCASPISTRVSPARADYVVAQKPTDAHRTIRDVSQLRSIEIVTDRDETVEQFFARRQLVLVDNANSDGKPCSVAQITQGDAAKFFASYPLQNDQGFRLFRYGDYYDLEKPAPAVAALFADDLALNWKNTLLILAPDATNTEDDLNKKARLVGRIFVKDRENWRPEMDAESLKYQPSEEKTEQTN